MFFEFCSLLTLLTCLCLLAASLWYCVDRFRHGFHVRSILLGLASLFVCAIPTTFFVGDEISFDTLAFGFLLLAVWWCGIADYMRRLDRRRLMVVGFVIASAFFLVCLLFFFIAFDTRNDPTAFGVI